MYYYLNITAHMYICFVCGIFANMKFRGNSNTVNMYCCCWTDVLLEALADTVCFYLCYSMFQIKIQHSFVQYNESSTQPVSYTHLDVYKRQALWRPNRETTQTAVRRRQNSKHRNNTNFISIVRSFKTVIWLINNYQCVMNVNTKRRKIGIVPKNSVQWRKYLPTGTWVVQKLKSFLPGIICHTVVLYMSNTFKSHTFL